MEILELTLQNSVHISPSLLKSLAVNWPSTMDLTMLKGTLQKSRLWDVPWSSIWRKAASKIVLPGIHAFEGNSPSWLCRGEPEICFYQQNMAEMNATPVVRLHKAMTFILPKKSVDFDEINQGTEGSL